ncbi:hypothetical protein [Rhodohalobacter sulfatireducens]|uniref:Uncharacterized protein n=1 Tax=Rhodohalobacter sulfatireducens TaxID=2911366 RepID=A0ABS9KE71_9BACT|nr:hypothetical protein [Rhodohalobacter sulfatireducens]MCG2589118.1 hypothetical protein [Rhodohalobacter sulfatireducens]
MLCWRFVWIHHQLEETEGTHHLAVFNQIVGHYKHLYTREKVDKVKGTSNQYGYLTDEARKSVLISGLKSAWVKEKLGYVEHNEKTVEQVSFFEIKDKGTMGAIIVA